MCRDHKRRTEADLYFFIFFEFMFSLKTAIPLSVNVTIDTGVLPPFPCFGLAIFLSVCILLLTSVPRYFAGVVLGAISRFASFSSCNSTLKYRTSITNQIARILSSYAILTDFL